MFTLSLFEQVPYIDLFVDSFQGCLDDLRIDGRPIPLPPKTNSTAWGQVTAYSNFYQTCQSPDVCANASCPSPLSCIDIWRQHTCGSV